MIVSNEKIAILMATYNGEKYIKEQIESLLCQSIECWCLYIHDDGSQDRTKDIVEEYSRKYPRKIVVLEGPSKGGAKNNFFYLLQSIDAPYVMFCDQDDVWARDKVEKTFDCMLKTERRAGKDKPVLVFTDLKVVDQNLNVIADRMSESQKLDPKKILFKDALIQNVVTGCTTMINNASLQKARTACNTDNIIMHDWWCELIAAYFGEIAFVDEPLIFYRQHEDNSVGAKQINSPSYILNKMKNTAEIRDSLVNTRNQAAEFAKTFNLRDDDLAMQYSRLGEKKKPERLLFYLRNHISKSGLARNIGLLIWG